MFKDNRVAVAQPGEYPDVARGKFFLKDHSTNGTYVRQGSDELLFLKRDLVQLQVVGEISLGRVPEMAPDSLIRYRII